MKLTIEVDGNAVMESVAKAIEAGAIDHWGSGKLVAADGDRAGYIAIEERLPGRSHTVKHRLGERTLRQGLEARRCAGLPALERGDAPHVVVDLLVQHALFDEVLYPTPERSAD